MAERTPGEVALSRLVEVRVQLAPYARPDTLDGEIVRCCITDVERAMDYVRSTLPPKPTRLGQEIIGGLTEFRDALRDGVPLDEIGVQRGRPPEGPVSDLLAAELFRELRAVEWAGETDLEEGGHTACCPSCGGEREHGHDDGCSLAAALAKAEGGTDGK